MFGNLRGDRSSALSLLLLELLLDLLWLLLDFESELRELLLDELVPRDEDDEDDDLCDDDDFEPDLLRLVCDLELLCLDEDDERVDLVDSSLLCVISLTAVTELLLSVVMNGATVAGFGGIRIIRLATLPLLKVGGTRVCAPLNVFGAVWARWRNCDAWPVGAVAGGIRINRGSREHTLDTKAGFTGAMRWRVLFIGGTGTAFTT